MNSIKQCINSIKQCVSAAKRQETRKPNTHLDSFMIYVGSGALSSAKQAELVKKDHLGGAIDTYTEVLFLTLMDSSQTSLP